MDERRGNIFIIGLIAFVLIAIIVTQLEKRKCDPLEKQAAINRGYLKDFFQFQRFQLKQTIGHIMTNSLMSQL